MQHPIDMPEQISILGSCVSRDAFTAAHDIAYYSARCSLATRALTPIACTVDPGLRNEITPFEERCIGQDFEKTSLLDLRDVRSAAVVIDLIDERHAINRIGDTGFSLSSAYRRGRDFISHPAVDETLTGEARLAFWRRSIEATLPALRGIASSTPVVLHVARWADTCRSATGDIVPVSPADRDKAVHFNGELDAMHGELARRLPGLRTIEVAPELTVADPNHRWGLAAFHYISEYYAAFRAQLEALTGFPAARSQSVPSADRHAGNDRPSASNR